MKKFKIIIIACCITSCSYGQAAIVSAPALEVMTNVNTGIQKKMALSMASLQAKQEMVEKALENAAWMKNLKTAKQLLTLIETLVCNGRELNKAISIGHKSCFVNFQYEMVIMKIQMSADFIGIILSAHRMSVAERMKSFNDVLIRFEEANKDMDVLVKKLKEEREFKKMMNDLDNNHPSGVRFFAEKN